MAKIKGEFDTTPEQEALLNEIFLPNINAERVANGDEPLADMDAYANWLLSVAVPDWAAKSKEKKVDDVADKYDAADPTVQAQVDALLEG